MELYHLKIYIDDLLHRAVGCNHCWTLELRVVQPLKIYPMMKIGQVTFWCIVGDTTLNYKNGKYNKYLSAEVSKFYESGGMK